MEAPQKEVEYEVIDVDDIDEGEKESSLVGRLVTEKHWNPSTLTKVIEKAWKPKHGMSWREWEDSNWIEIQKDHFKFVAGIQHSKKYSLDHGFLCNYDGLYLKCFDTPDRGAYKEIWCPLSIDDSNDERALYGIYYNPLVKDYVGIVAKIEDGCSEVKDMKDFSYSSRSLWYGGRCFDWTINIERVGSTYDFEIICFDWKVEKFKKLPMPDFKEKPDRLDLNSSGSHLCLVLSCYKEIGLIEMSNWKDENEMSIWKKVSVGEKDSWMEFKVKLEIGSSYTTYPICWVNESEILLEVESYADYYFPVVFTHNSRQYCSIPKISKHNMLTEKIKVTGIHDHTDLDKKRPASTDLSAGKKLASSSHSCSSEMTSTSSHLIFCTNPVSSTCVLVSGFSISFIKETYRTYRTKLTNQNIKDYSNNRKMEDISGNARSYHSSLLDFDLVLKVDSTPRNTLTPTFHDKKHSFRCRTPSCSSDE
ncbi:hypothetical protein ACS0TY_022591 [Phlomoides rotata]